MFCPKCGKTLPDDASFCLKCGAAQRPRGKAVAADPRWETSEVHANKLSDGNATTQWQFVVEADGPEGKRMLFASRAFASTSVDLASGTEGTGYKEEMDQLFRTLTSDGWEPLPRGKNWFSYRFRRRVR
jgi:hypothetical protein